MLPADLFSALADPTRLRMLEMLHEKARPVHALAGAFRISRPAISRHLRVLKEAGLVREIKKGRENVYSLQAGKLRPAIDWLERHRPVAKPAKAAKSAPTKATAKSARPAAATKVKPAKVPAAVIEAPKPTPVPALAAPQLSFFDL